jgi:hypothetical protein
MSIICKQIKHISSLSIAAIIQRQIREWLVNNKLENVEENDLAQTVVLSQHLPREKGKARNPSVGIT